MRIAVNPLVVLRVFACIAIAMPAEAVPYNEKRAFCREKLSYSCEINGVWGRCPHYGEYETTKRFNQCIQDADRLIREDEKEKKRWKKEYQQKRQIEQAREKERQRQKAILESERQKNIQHQVDNMEDFFR